MTVRSLLNGQEKFITYQIGMEGQTFQGVGLIWSILRRHVPENIHTKIKGMRALASMDGAVFDVEEHQVQTFDDAFEHAKESG
jgi:hypothetical protein